LEPKSEYSPSSSKSHQFEEPSVKTEPGFGEWKTENSCLVLPVQCDIVKPKMMKLFDGTVILNGQPQLAKKRLSSDKQSFQRLPAYLKRVLEIFECSIFSMIFQKPKKANSNSNRNRRGRENGREQPGIAVQPETLLEYRRCFLKSSFYSNYFQMPLLPALPVKLTKLLQNSE
jgi:hypothetical protein